jgi:hypothetical protein
MHLSPPFRTMRRVGALVALLSVGLSLTACTGVGDPIGNDRFGAITISATGSGSGPFIAIPTAVFFTGLSSSVPTSKVASDQCGTFNYRAETYSPGDLSAGPALEVRVGSAVRSMTEPAGIRRLYALSSPNYFEYSPGDSLRLSIPGASGGFPASAIAVRLAEPIRLGPLPVLNVNDNVPISWETNGDANSGVIISFRWASGTSTVAGPDQQVLCIVRDNGAYTVAGTLLGNFYASEPSQRSLNVLRWRTNSTSIDARTTLYIVSSLDTTTTLRF